MLRELKTFPSQVDGVIQETKNLMNEIAKLVTSCFLCATKVRGLEGRGDGLMYYPCFHSKRKSLSTVRVFYIMLQLGGPSRINLYVTEGT